MDTARNPKWDKVLGILAMICKVILAVVILFGVDYIVAFSMLFLRINYTYYVGTFYFISGVLAAVLLYIFSRVEGQMHEKKRANLIRFNKPGISGVVSGIVIAFAILGFVTFYMYIVNLLSVVQEDVSEAVEQYKDQVEAYKPEIVYPVWDQLLYAFTLTFIVPISEEFTFRGIIYGAINRKLNAAWAIVLSALVFGLMHGVSVHIGYALAAGLIIGLAYYAFDSIFVCMVIHSVFNFFGSAVYIVGDSLGVKRNQIPGFFTLQLLMFIPAAMILGYSVLKRRDINRQKKLEAEAEEVAASEQA